MRMFPPTFILCATLTLIVPSLFQASFAGAQGEPEMTAPQGEDPPGADNGAPLPPQQDGEVVTPPPTGDEEIYTDAPNPEAGHDKEVIPPPAIGEEPEDNPR